MPLNKETKRNLCQWYLFKLACFDSGVQRLNHYATGTLPVIFRELSLSTHWIKVFVLHSRTFPVEGLRELQSKHFDEKQTKKQRNKQTENYFKTINLLYCYDSNQSIGCPDGWRCRIHRLHLSRGFSNECPSYDTKQSDGDVLVMLELWNVEHLFIAITPRFTQAQWGHTWYGPVYGFNRANLSDYTELNYLK